MAGCAAGAGACAGGLVIASRNRRSISWFLVCATLVWPSGAVAGELVMAARNRRSINSVLSASAPLELGVAAAGGVPGAGWACESTGQAMAQKSAR